MAIQLEKPRRPINVVLRSFARQAVKQLKDDFRIQHIYPYEIYPGFKRVNEYREKHGGWYATGKGIKSFQFDVISAANGNETIKIEYLAHLFLSNMGVVPGTTLEDVHRERKARYNKRYVAIWDNRGGETHRPSIMREARFLQHRMINYLQDFYAREVEVSVYKTFSGMHAINLDV